MFGPVLGKKKARRTTKAVVWRCDTVDWQGFANLLPTGRRHDHVTCVSRIYKRGPSTLTFRSLLSPFPRLLPLSLHSSPFPPYTPNSQTLPFEVGFQTFVTSGEFTVLPSASGQSRPTAKHYLVHFGQKNASGRLSAMIFNRPIHSRKFTNKFNKFIYNKNA